MALIKCEECGNSYSSQAKNCVHCGAPTPESLLTYWLNGLQVICWLLAGFFILKAVLPFIVPMLQSDGIAESDLTCSSSNLNDQMKSVFDQSPYALSNNLKAVLIESQDISKTNESSLVTCNTTLTLNNNQTISYVFDVTKNTSGGENAGYLISALPIPE